MVNKSTFNFPVVLEVLVWIFYVCCYKYSYYLEHSNLPTVPHNDLPYLQICLYAMSTTLGLVPYYRIIVHKLLKKRCYWWLFLTTIIYFIILAPSFNRAIAWVFTQGTGGMVVNSFFKMELNDIFLNWDIVMTDSIAFLCVAFSRFSYYNEQLRHKIEKDHLQLQLEQLKSQLQPHFLFNTLNSLYGMSLTESKETPRFILLLSKMMQYILYDCNTEKVSLKQETDFLMGYFEIEQKKFPKALISLKIQDNLPELLIPPLLYLPLVENSFKHGRHKLVDLSTVKAHLTFENKKLVFSIENEMLPPSSIADLIGRGGIGLNNINQRMKLYYPKHHNLTINDNGLNYRAELIISKP